MIDGVMKTARGAMTELPDAMIEAEAGPTAVSTGGGELAAKAALMTESGRQMLARGSLVFVGVQPMSACV